MHSRKHKMQLLQKKEKGLKAIKAEEHHDKNWALESDFD